MLFGLVSGLELPLPPRILGKGIIARVFAGVDSEKSGSFLVSTAGTGFGAGVIFLPDCAEILVKKLKIINQIAPNFII